MSYNIEILTTDAHQLADIAKAMEPINKVQKEFRFEIASARELSDAYTFTRENYEHRETADWIAAYRVKNKGYKPFIILILNGTLNQNHYGGHRATDGIAYFTVHGHGQFVVDKLRFIRYYLVRYALSFVAPEIIGHEEPRNCMFDRKTYKRDITLSLNSGRLCDDCQRSIGKVSNPEINEALKDLLQLISNQYPYALVLKGGGAKGLALVGALLELEKYYSFNTFAGTSAGAIAAVLLGAGYTPSELKQILKETDFKEFANAPWLKRLYNLIVKGGFESGNRIKEWIDDLLQAKIEQQTTIRMKHLPKRAIVYASRRDEGVIAFDKDGEFRDTYAKSAVRCSMSIPVFFIPQKMDDEKVYDGGLGNNFPLRKFIRDNQSNLFIGLYLKGWKPKNMIGEWIDIATDADERQVVDENKDKVVVIDPFPIKTTQFTLNEKEKTFLIDAGRLGALQFLHKHNIDAGITESEVKTLQEDVDKQRAALM